MVSFTAAVPVARDEVQVELIEVAECATVWASEDKSLDVSAVLGVSISLTDNPSLTTTDDDGSSA